MNNLRTPQIPAKTCPLFFMVHLLHRLYGVDAPAAECITTFGVDDVAGAVAMRKDKLSKRHPVE